MPHQRAVTAARFGEGTHAAKMGDEWQHGGAREILIPFIADAIKQVDLAAGLIAVDWGRDY